jgi:hypothetical protein
MLTWFLCAKLVTAKQQFKSSTMKLLLIFTFVFLNFISTNANSGEAAVAIPDS